MCVPSTEFFKTNILCRDATVYHDQVDVNDSPLKQAACPPGAALTGRPREVLPAGVSCNSLRDRSRCSRAIDGRSHSYHVGQPCVPAAIAFENGEVCRTAREVSNFEPRAAASGVEFESSDLSYLGVNHEMQRITMRQANPRRLVQTVRFTAISCPTGSNCIGGKYDTVKFSNQGKLTSTIKLSSSATTIKNALIAILDDTYSAIDVTISYRTKNETEWQLAIRTPFTSCTEQPKLPLLEARLQAKVRFETETTAFATCLSGHVEVATDASFAGAAALSWDASVADAEAAIRSVVSGDVQVHRGGDGHGEVTFDVTYLGNGDWPLLHVRKDNLHRVQRQNATHVTVTDEVVIYAATQSVEWTQLDDTYLAGYSTPQIVDSTLACFTFFF